MNLQIILIYTICIRKQVDNENPLLLLLYNYRENENDKLIAYVSIL